MTRKRRKPSCYVKSQTIWARVPSAIEARRFHDIVAVRLWPERKVTDVPSEPATIWLTAHEAQGLAAWLSDAAEHLLAKQVRAAARAAARAEGRKP